MAGQFDKFVKILGTGSRPDRAVGTWKGTNPDGGPAGQPVEMSIPVEQPKGSSTSSDGGGKQKKVSRPAAVPLDARPGGNNTRKRGTVSAPMPGALAPVPALSAEVDTKVDKTDEQRDIEAGEYSFNRGEEAKGSGLRSLNGVTYDMKDYSDYLDSLPANEMSKAPSPYDVSDFEPKSSVTATTPSADDRPSAIVNTKPLNSKMVDNRDNEIEDEQSRKTVREYEQKSKGLTTVEYGDTLSEKNKKSTFKEPSRITGYRAVTERPTAIVDEGMPEPKLGEKGEYTGITTTGSFDPYNEDGTLSEAAKDGILSTTMREVRAEGPAKVVGRVPIRAPREAAPFEKPPVVKTGNPISQRVIDTYTGGSADVDEEQAKQDRRNRTPLTSTGPYDPNKTPGRDTFGRTPERRATQAAMRETRAAELAAQGQEMTTVAPHIMKSAVALAKSSRFNITDDSYLSSTQFLDHPAVQEATIAHAFGVHHDFSILHNALGGRAPEIARRREAWFKVADRKLRGNPEKVPGEFDTLGAAIRKGTTPTTVTRKLERGQKPGITINGQTPTLAPAAPIADVRTPTRAGDRAMHANTTANIMYQQQQAAKEAHKIMTFTPLKTTTMRLNEATGEAYDSDNKEELLKNTAQASGATSSGIAPAGSDMVTVRNKNNPDQPAVTRPFTKKERLNKGNVPTSDDSKGRF